MRNKESIINNWGGGGGGPEDITYSLNHAKWYFYRMNVTSALTPIFIHCDLTLNVMVL